MAQPAQHQNGPLSPQAGPYLLASEPAVPRASVTQLWGSEGPQAPLALGACREMPQQGETEAGDRPNTGHGDNRDKRDSRENFPSSPVAEGMDPSQHTDPCSPIPSMPPSSPLSDADGRSRSQPRAAVIEDKAVPFGTIPLCVPPQMLTAGVGSGRAGGAVPGPRWQGQCWQ